MTVSIQLMVLAVLSFFFANASFANISLQPNLNNMRKACSYLNSAEHIRQVPPACSKLVRTSFAKYCEQLTGRQSKKSISMMQQSLNQLGQERFAKHRNLEDSLRLVKDGHKVRWAKIVTSDSKCINAKTRQMARVVYRELDRAEYKLRKMANPQAAVPMNSNFEAEQEIDEEILKEAGVKPDVDLLEEQRKARAEAKRKWTEKVRAEAERKRRQMEQQKKTDQEKQAEAEKEKAAKAKAEQEAAAKAERAMLARKKAAEAKAAAEAAAKAEARRQELAELERSRVERARARKIELEREQQRQRERERMERLRQAEKEKERLAEQRAIPPLPKQKPARQKRVNKEESEIPPLPVKRPETEQKREQRQARESNERVRQDERRQPENQEEQQARPDEYIHKIEFVDDDGTVMNTAKYLRHVKTRVGDRISVDGQPNSKVLLQVNDDIKGLLKKFSGFAEISKVYVPEKLDANKKPVLRNGRLPVILRYEFLRKRYVRQVVILIPDEVKEPRKGLQRRLKTRAGALVRGAMLSEDIGQLRKIFAKAGFPKVQVTHKVDKLRGSQENVRVTFNVILNSRKSHVTDLKLIGVRSLAKGDVEEVMQVTPKGFIEGIFGRRVFNVVNVDRDKQAIINLYKKRGYQDVKVDTDFKLDPRSADATVIIKVDEGRRYGVRSITIDGNQYLSDERFRSLLAIKEGDAYTHKAIVKSQQALRNAYAQAGYVFATVFEKYDTETESLNFSVKEGNVHFIERIEIVGNTSTNDKTIRTFFDLYEGDIVNQARIDEGKQNLMATTYFSSVKVDYEPKTPRSGVVHIVVEEASMKSINLGIGYATAGGIEGDAQFGYKNIAGKGIDFSISGAKSEELTRLELMFRDRHFLGKKLDATATVFYEERDYRQFDRNSLGARAIIEKEIVKNLYLGLGTRVEFVGIDDVQVGMPQEVFDHQAEGRKFVGGVISRLVYYKEKKDQNGDEVGGYRVSLAFLPSYSDGEVFAKAASTAVGHIRIATDKRGRSHVLTGRITLAYATENTPFFERLYAGGNATVRGFDGGSLRPNGSKLGGSVLVSGGAYYSFPVYGKKFRGVVFVEAASIGNGVEDLGNVRVNAGVGVRANLQDTFLKSRIEAGFMVPAISEPDDETKPFYIMFGNFHPNYDL